MQGKVISIRLNTDKLTDRTVDEILSNLPSRRKSEYIRNAIIAYDNQKNMLELMKLAVLETMEELELKRTEKKNKNGESEYGYDDYFKSL